MDRGRIAASPVTFQPCNQACHRVLPLLQAQPTPSPAEWSSRLDDEPSVTAAMWEQGGREVIRKAR